MRSSRQLVKRPQRVSCLVTNRKTFDCRDFALGQPLGVSQTVTSSRFCPGSHIYINGTFGPARMSRITKFSTSVPQGGSQQSSTASSEAPKTAPGTGNSSKNNIVGDTIPEAAGGAAEGQGEQVNEDAGREPSSSHTSQLPTDVPTTNGPQTPQSPTAAKEEGKTTVTSDNSSKENTTVDRSTQNTGSSDSGDQQTKEEYEGENSSDTGSNWTRRAKKGTLALGIVLGLPLLFCFHKCDYSVGKTELYLAKRFHRLIFGDARTTDAARESKFLVFLQPETQRELANYFLQLDLDKENGVRRSDIIDLAKESGFEVDAEKNPLVKDFILRGRGQTRTIQATSGVTLQEVGEFLEKLVLETPWSDETGTKDEVTTDDVGTKSAEETDDANVIAAKRWEVEILRVLRTRNAGAVPSSILPETNFKFTMQRPPKSLSGQSEILLDAANDEDLIVIIKQEIEMAQKTVDKLKQRKNLTVAETQRRKDLENTLRDLKKQLRQAESSHRLLVKEKKLSGSA